MDTDARQVVVNLPFERALAETGRALCTEGLHLLGRCDVREFLSSTLHHDFLRYILLDVAPAQSTLDALLEDLSAGPLLPTRIAVYEVGKTETAIVVAEPFGGLCSDPQWRRASPRLATLGDHACAQLARALDRLQRVAARQESTSPVTATT